MEQQEKCIKAILLAVDTEGAYTTYVFQNISPNKNPLVDDDIFIMATKCPNWTRGDIEIMQEGYLTYKYVRAGIDTYYDRKDQTHKVYLYNAIYFQDFVPITHVLSNGYVVEKNKLKVS